MEAVTCGSGVGATLVDQRSDRRSQATSPTLDLLGCSAGSVPTATSTVVLLFPAFAAVVAWQRGRPAASTDGVSEVTCGLSVRTQHTWSLR